MRVLPGRIQIALALVPALAGAQIRTATPQAISIDAAVRMAQRNSPLTTEGRGVARLSRASVTSALSQFLPAVGLSTSANHSAGATFFQGHQVPFSGNPWSYNRGYNAFVTLFQGGRRLFDYSAARATLQASAENERALRHSVGLSVKMEYYAVLAAYEAEAAAARQLEAAEAQLQIAVARLQAGTANRFDSLHCAALVAAARVAVITAQRNQRTADAALTRFTASTIPLTASVSDTAVIPDIPADSAGLERMASDAPTLRQARLLFSATKSAKRASFTSYLPALTMTYHHSDSKSSPRFDWGGSFPSYSKGYGFTLSYVVFDNFSRELEVTQARVSEDEASASLRDAGFEVSQNLVSFLGVFRAARESIDLERLQIVAAQEALRGQQDRYRNGTGTLVEVIVAQSTLDNARLALINARLQARTAKAQIEALIGRELQ